jgi:hypothetical protein
MVLPKYAQSTPKHLLVKYFCKRKCANTRYGRVSKVPWTPVGLNDDPELFVTCLFCGGKQSDKYNWIRM